MSFLNLLDALATGAATFTLNPELSAVEIVPKSSTEAFREDTEKLKRDFDRHFIDVSMINEEARHITRAGSANVHGGKNHQ